MLSTNDHHHGLRILGFWVRPQAAHHLRSAGHCQRSLTRPVKIGPVGTRQIPSQSSVMFCRSSACLCFSYWPMRLGTSVRSLRPEAGVVIIQRPRRKSPREVRCPREVQPVRVVRKVRCPRGVRSIRVAREVRCLR